MNNATSSGWKSFQWVRNGETGGRREGFTPDIFSEMTPKEKSDAKNILLDDLANGAPFSDIGLAQLLNEEVIELLARDGISLTKMNEINIYGELLLSTKNSLYVDKLVSMFRGLDKDNRAKNRICYYLQSSKRFSDTADNISLIIGEESNEMRARLASALYCTLANTFNEFDIQVLKLYSKIENSEDKIETRRYIEELVMLAKRLKQK